MSDWEQASMFFPDYKDEKYVVFKREDFDSLVNEISFLCSCGRGRTETIENVIAKSLIDDAVVIRRQDVFAPPAFDAYANSIMVTIEALKERGITHEGNNPSMVDRLGAIADYFHAQADMAWDTHRKIPD